MKEEIILLFKKLIRVSLVSFVLWAIWNWFVTSCISVAGLSVSFKNWAIFTAIINFLCDSFIPYYYARLLLKIQLVKLCISSGIVVLLLYLL